MSDVTYRWINGIEATQQEWDDIDMILAARGWMSLSHEREMARILIAEKDGVMVGFSILQFTPYCGPLYVTPSERGTGLAGVLAEQTFTFLMEQKARGWIVVASSPHVPYLCEKFGMHKIESPVYTTEIANGGEF